MKTSELIQILANRLVEYGDLEVVYKEEDFSDPKEINHSSILDSKNDRKVCLKTYWE